MNATKKAAWMASANYKAQAKLSMDRAIARAEKAVNSGKSSPQERADAQAFLAKQDAARQAAEAKQRKAAS